METVTRLAEVGKNDCAVISTPLPLTISTRNPPPADGDAVARNAVRKCRDVAGAPVTVMDCRITVIWPDRPSISATRLNATRNFHRPFLSWIALNLGQTKGNPLLDQTAG